jgi:hypothetical protein
VTFTDASTALPHFWFNKSTDRGLTWGTPIQVDHATTGNDRGGAIPKEVLDGTIYVSWDSDDRTGIDTEGIFCARSTDGGATFQNEVLVQSTKFLFNSSNPSLYQITSLEPSPLNPSELYLMFNDSRGLNCQDRFNMNVYCTRSTDGGLT